VKDIDFESLRDMSAKLILRKLYQKLHRQLERLDFYTYVLSPTIQNFFSKPQRSILPSTIGDLKEFALSNNWRFEIRQSEFTQIFNPSKTIEEEILDIINNGPRRIKNFYASRSARSISRGEILYSRLYSVSTSVMSETFECEVPDAIIVNPGGIVMTSDLHPIEQSVDGYDDSCLRLAKTQNILSKRVETLPGRYISLLTKRCWEKGNYAHWLMEALPKLDILKSLNNEFKVIVPSNPYPFILSSLSLLGIPKERIVAANFQVISVDNLILAHAAQRTGVPNKVHLGNIRNKLKCAVLGEHHSATMGQRLVYISRSRASRGLINEVEIRPILDKYGFETLICEDLSFEDQVKIFSEAKVVLGPHGAGIYNQIFCHPGATIIEIYNKDYWYRSSLSVSNIMGHIHWHIFGPTAGKGWATWVDPNKLQRLLTVALA
jgi:hypothetical protein